ncbi:MAG: hypothetical protein JJT76_10235 [Clostridiaceae bacterium]|nr:hypothetical protein [Clostridiaceae bacterium]
MGIYIKEKYRKQLVPLTIFLLIIFLLSVSLRVEVDFSNNNDPSNTIYLQSLSQFTHMISYISTHENYKEFIRVQPMNILWFILFFFFHLIKQPIENYYETVSFSWLFLRLRQLLIPKQHRSSYKDFLSITLLNNM